MNADERNLLFECDNKEAIIVGKNWPLQRDWFELTYDGDRILMRDKAECSLIYHGFVDDTWRNACISTYLGPKVIRFRREDRKPSRPAEKIADELRRIETEIGRLRYVVTPPAAPKPRPPWYRRLRRRRATRSDAA